MRHRSIAPAFVVTVSTVAACAPPSGSGSPNEPDPHAVATSSVPEPEPEPEPEPVRDPATVPTTDPAPRDAGAAPEPDPDEVLRLSDFPVTLNARDAQNRVIKRNWQGDACYVELPFPPLKPGQQRPPGSAPPAQKIACPREMLAPTYEQCRGGVVHGKNDGSACICFVMGNPPPPPRRVGCPAKP